MSRKEDFANDIITLYTKNGFGKILKSELDLAVFHYLLLEYLDPSFKDGNIIKYFLINKSQIYKLSISLGISESRIKKYLEEDYFKYKKGNDLNSFLLNEVNGRTIKNILSEGKLQLVIPNPITRKYLEEKAYSTGGIINYEQNREIMIIEIYDFLKIINFAEKKEIAELIKTNIIRKSRSSSNSLDMDNFMKELNKMSIEERLKIIAIGTASKIIGKAGDEIIGAIIDIANSKNQANSK